MVQPQHAPRFGYFILGSSLILASLACQVQLGGPRPAVPPIEFASDSSADLAEAWEAALEDSGGTGEVAIRVNESQLNAFLGEWLEADANPLILQPQVYLRQDQIDVYGITTYGIFQVSVHVSIRPVLNPDGRLEFEIISASFGPSPAPEIVKDAVSKLISEAVSGAFGPLATGIRVTSIAITDGQMTIVGTIQ